MANIRYRVKVSGVRPLLINRFRGDEEKQEKGLTRGKKDYGTPEEQAKAGLYVDENGKLFFPSTWIMGALKTSGKDFKQKGKRSSVQGIVGAAVVMDVENVYFNEDYTSDNIEIDARGAVVPATKGRVMRYRAKLPKWSADFDLIVESAMLDEAALTDLVKNAGRIVGLGDFRAAKGGPFGMFKLESIEAVETLAYD